jgi:hypothetical protein
VKVGADAIATVPPLFFKPKTVGKSFKTFNLTLKDDSITNIKKCNFRKKNKKLGCIVRHRMYFSSVI